MVSFNFDVGISENSITSFLLGVWLDKSSKINFYMVHGCMPIWYPIGCSMNTGQDAKLAFNFGKVMQICIMSFLQRVV